MEKQTLLKQLSFGIVIVGVLSVGTVAFYIKKDRSLDSLPNFPMRSTPEDWAEHVKIGIIGDSWVAGRNLDQAITDSMRASGVAAEVVSSGYPGAKSRQIYRNLLSPNQSGQYSSHEFLMDDDLDYLVVVAGVNDTAGHIGKGFYAHHMWSIIKIALNHGLHPVIMEVPEYGIEDTPAGSFLSLAKKMIYLVFF